MTTKKKTSPKSRKSAGKKPAARVVDPSSADALRALSSEYAAQPDIPIGVAIQEFASLSRLSKTSSARLLKAGITMAQIDGMARFATRLRGYETAWQRARASVKLASRERQELADAELLKRKLLDGGRWALRKDQDALEELARIAEGSGIEDLIQDLTELVGFWGSYAAALRHTDITSQDLSRAAALADSLDAAARKEANSLDAAAAMELRNRCYWAADELARELREGGRYVYRLEPKTAAKFSSRYRVAAKRRVRNKAKPQPAPAPSGA